MLHTLKLLLPAIIPSWRFFDIIAPSPRIEFTLLSSRDEPPLEKWKWQEFRPRPPHLSFMQMLGRMFWNPWCNESLFLVSCAERLLQQPTEHSEDEILKRIAHDVKTGTLLAAPEAATHLQFRLILIQRIDSELQQTVVFHSRIQPLFKQDAA